MYIPKGAGRKSAAFVFLLPSLVGVVVFCLVPIVTSLVFSLMDYDTLRPMTEMQFIAFKNYGRILTGTEFLRVTQHTLTYLVLYLPLILCASLVQGLVLDQTFRGRGAFRTISYTPVITSWVAAAVVWQWILSGKYGLLN